jgi:hypothetical protein
MECAMTKRLGRTVLLASMLLVATLLVAQEAGKVPFFPGTPVPADAVRFNFVVFTDLFSGKAPGSTVFAEAVDEINLLDPDFITCVGDFTNDGSAKSWDEALPDIRRLKRPFYPVYGNHDSPTLTRMKELKERVGRTWYSFDYKGCHFIVLFTEEYDDTGKHIGIGTEQRAWLLKDLDASKDAKHTFLFFHKPAFYDGSWGWAEIEKALAGRPASVFAGHTHDYNQFERAGINYHVFSTTGGAQNGDLYAGGFYHYALVTVTGGKVSVAIIRVGAVLPDTLLSSDRLKAIGDAREQMKEVRLTVPRGAKTVGQPLEVNVPNPLPGTVNGTLEWEIPSGSPWKVEPKELPISVAGGAAQKLRFNVTLEGDPFSAAWELLPRWRLRVFGTRDLNSHSSAAAGMDALYDDGGPLCPDRWPYASSLAPVRKSLVMPKPQLSDNFRQTYSFTIKNTLDGDLAGEMTWEVANAKWKVTPGKAALKVAKGATQEVTFDATFAGAPEDVFPLPRLRTVATCDGEPALDEVQPVGVSATGFFRGMRREITCRALASKPTLDGRLDDAAWKDAAAFAPFILNGGGSEPQAQTTVRAGYTDEGLMFAVAAHDPSRQRVHALATKHDDPMGKDDTFHVFLLDPRAERRSWYQFAFNAIGNGKELKDRVESWNGRWDVKTGWDADGWTAEVFIPWATLGGKPEKGTKWALDLFRVRPQAMFEVGAWVPTFGNVSPPARSGEMTFE